MAGSCATIQDTLCTYAFFNGTQETEEYAHGKLRMR